MKHLHMNQKSKKFILSAMLGVMILPGTAMTAQAAEQPGVKGEYLDWKISDAEKGENSRVRNTPDKLDKQVATVVANALNVQRNREVAPDLLLQLQWEEQYDLTGEAKTEEAEKTEEVVETEPCEEEVQEENVGSAPDPGQEVIDFACQFIGNPYVYGGTSLTQGTDCSGFVQAVYANFGVALPRTTYDMVGVGTEIPFDQAKAGDIILYDGHVGLYMGDGTIVNAMNEAQGIGICNVDYAPVIAVRRVL